MKGPYKGKFKVTQEFKGSAHDGLDLVGLTDKKIYSTVNGTVERAGWENSQNKKQARSLHVAYSSLFIFASFLRRRFSFIFTR